MGLEGDKFLARPAIGAVQRGCNACSCRELALSSHSFRRGLEPSSPRFFTCFLLTPFLFEDIHPAPLFISKRPWAGGVLSPFLYNPTQWAADVNSEPDSPQKGHSGGKCIWTYLDVSGCIKRGLVHGKFFSQGKNNHPVAAFHRGGSASG